MNITVENLVTQYPLLAKKVKLPKQLDVNEFKSVNEVLDLYNEEDTIKQWIDMFVEKLNLVAAKMDDKKPEEEKKENKTNDQKKTIKTKSKVKTEKKPIVKAKAKVKVQKTEKKKEVKKPGLSKEGYTSKDFHITVASKPRELSFIRRYVALNGQTITRNEVARFLKALQSAIVRRIIRKTSLYAKEIEHIQNNLVRLYNTMGTSNKVEIADNTIKEYTTILERYKIASSVQYIKRFLTIYFGDQSKEKAKRLHDSIEHAMSQEKLSKQDVNYQKLISIKSKLKQMYESHTVDLPEQELNGLLGASGNKKKTLSEQRQRTGIISSLELQGVSFITMPMSGIWKKAIGDPEIPFIIMIYGPGGKGKSTFAVQFASYLSKDKQKKVIYIASEEKVSKKVQDKCRLFNAFNPKLFFSGQLPEDLKPYDVVILDSVTYMKITPAEFDEIRNKTPKTSFIYILQTNKKGDFYGLKQWEHNCDTVLRFEDGLVITEKNRFGDAGEHKIPWRKPL